MNIKDEGYPKDFHCYICEKVKKSPDYFFRIGDFDWVACEECFKTLNKLREKSGRTK